MPWRPARRTSSTPTRADYESVSALIDGVDAYFAFYNWERPHQSFDYDTPAQVYHQLSEMQAAG